MSDVLVLTKEELDFNAVQRGDAEMQQKAGRQSVTS